VREEPELNCLRTLAVALALASSIAITACGGDAQSAPTVTPQPGITASPQAAGDDASEAEKVIAQVLNGPHNAIKSPDGSAEVLVPPSALPAGLDSGAIKIAPVAPAESGITIGGQPPDAVYKLEPDGTKFSSPVVVRFTLAADAGGGLPSLYLQSGQELTLLESYSAEVDSQSGRTTVSAPILHFSRLIASSAAGDFAYSGMKVEDQVAGVPFTVELRLRPEKTAWEVYDTHVSGYVAYELVEWSIRGEWLSNGPIEPRFVKDAPPLTKVGSPSFPLQQQFVCTGPGSFSEISYEGLITGVMREDQTRDQVLNRERPFHFRFSLDSDTFRCEAGTPTPVPPPTATPLPDPDVFLLSSRFDDGLEGWTPRTSGCVAMEYQGGGGNPGGFLFVDNNDQIVCRLLAPEKFRGGRNLRGYYGGTISFDGKMFDALDPTWDGRHSTGGEGFNYGTITIAGTAGTIQTDSVIVPREPKPNEEPWTNWQSHSVTIAAGKGQVGSGLWTDLSGKNAVTEAQIIAVLKSVTSIDLNVEAIFGREKQGVDNFVMAPPPWNPLALNDVPPVVVEFSALYESFRHTTSYRVRVFDDDKDGLRFKWSLSNICGDWKWDPRRLAEAGSAGDPLATSEAFWTHTNCFGEPNHEATITVEVTDSDDNSVTCQYIDGSRSTQELPETLPEDRRIRYPEFFDCAD